MDRNYVLNLLVEEFRKYERANGWSIEMFLIDHVKVNMGLSAPSGLRIIWGTGTNYDGYWPQKAQTKPTLSKHVRAGWVKGPMYRYWDFSWEEIIAAATNQQPRQLSLF